MIDALYIANTGLKTQQAFIDTISNNIVNLNTPGFKKTSVNFADLAYSASRTDDAGQAQGSRAEMHGAGARISSTQSVFTAGNLRLTERPLDLAIHGAGFLEVLSEDGTPRYTRAGGLGVDRDGFLVNANGLRLAARIQVPPDTTELSVAADGAVSVRIPGESDPVSLGVIDLARFTNPEGLRPLGDGLFGATDSSGDAWIGRPGEDGIGELVQGALEMSNVDMVEEMTSLVLAQRAYQLNARVLQTSDQILETINNLRR